MNVPADAVLGTGAVADAVPPVGTVYQLSVLPAFVVVADSADGVAPTQ
jgi:hypothetical protein